jgi:hypothetical protein
MIAAKQQTAVALSLDSRAGSHARGLAHVNNRRQDRDPAAWEPPAPLRKGRADLATASPADYACQNLPNVLNWGYGGKAMTTAVDLDDVLAIAAQSSTLDRVRLIGRLALQTLGRPGAGSFD